MKAQLYYCTTILFHYRYNTQTQTDMVDLGLHKEFTQRKKSLSINRKYEYQVQLFYCTIYYDNHNNVYTKWGGTKSDCCGLTAFWVRV